MQQGLALATRTAQRRRRASLVVVAVVCVLVGLAAVALASIPRAPARTTAAPSTVQVGDVSSDSTRSNTASSGSPDADERLQQQRASDRAALSREQGSWFPQVSSKKVGLVADGITYDASAIWDQFQTIAASHSDARLVYTDDWGTFRSGGYWVTLIDAPSTLPATANAWCDAQGFPKDQCYAKRLNATGGPTGNTVMRR